MPLSNYHLFSLNFGFSLNFILPVIIFYLHFNQIIFLEHIFHIETLITNIATS